MVQDRWFDYASPLRFPKRLALTIALFIVDIIVQDMIPFVGELFLGLYAALLSMIKRRQSPGPGLPIFISPLYLE